MIAREKLEFKGHTRRNNQYCVAGKPLDWRDRGILDLLISREINDYFMVLIKGVEQDPDLGMNFFHPSNYDDSKAIDSDKQENNDENAPKTPYGGENMNTSSDDGGNTDKDDLETPYDGENINAYYNNEGNIDEVAPDPSINDININANSDDKKNYYEVIPYTPTNGRKKKELQ